MLPTPRPPSRKARLGSPPMGAPAERDEPIPGRDSNGRDERKAVLTGQDRGLQLRGLPSPGTACTRSSGCLHPSDALRT